MYVCTSAQVLNVCEAENIPLVQDEERVCVTSIHSLVLNKEWDVKVGYGNHHQYLQELCHSTLWYLVGEL